MKNKPIFILLVVILVLGSASIGYAYLADYEIQPWTVDAGGGISENNQYSLSGTIGQADSGYLHGGDYSLAGGLWGGGRIALQQRYIPIIIR